MTESITNTHTADPVSRQSYDPRSFELLQQVDDQHFWFTTRNRLIVNLAKKALGPGAGLRLLEVGCGNGNVLRWLHRAFPGSTVVGMDLFPQGLEFARQRTPAPLLVADAHQAPFAATFDLLGMFDVLEHLEEDCAMLSTAATLLRPGGTLFLTVPAYMALWSEVDVAAHHCRRYEVNELRSKLAASGFTVQFLSPFMASLLPLLYTARTLRGAGAIHRNNGLATQELKIVPGVNQLLSWVLDRENQLLLRGVRLPFGTSLLALATKQ